MSELLLEAARNVVRHANASTIEVELHARDGLLTAVVRDNGCGLSQSEIESSSGGIANLEQRARKRGGNVRWESIAGRGTDVTIALPARADAA